jgi:uncharacterized protein (DUF849 family)
VGLEDASFGTEATNRMLVEEAVRLIRSSGGEIASVRDMREALAWCR